ncbi:DUF309 domain-containing protein [Candidatus Chloroploca asiatica]|uniref:DUF309 domain-containing protein n=1 Tax=Candidatus Chloroploca asiatica TaxID=1506545 RepID=A0A2H3L4H9_9CHLR|nr:DUF309 domain-containing protein [Candidatus Chloroploca asiatica]PDV98076.1 hypothetical protein A9Q02_03070 [Candidatus Chloroploca asiatica]
MREDTEHLEVAYREGLRLFNAGHYWHAHEQWEYCWLRVEGEAATFYKAIIQTAAALVKWQQGNRRGLALNWAKSRQRLLSLPRHYQGLDLVKLRQAMDALDDGASEAPPVLMVVQ